MFILSLKLDNASGKYFNSQTPIIIDSENLPAVSLTWNYPESFRANPTDSITAGSLQSHIPKYLKSRMTLRLPKKKSGCDEHYGQAEVQLILSDSKGQ